MDSELVDKLLPIVGVFIGAIIGFLGNYFLNNREFKKQQIVKKDDHLKELLNEFIDGLNGLLNLTDDITESLIFLHNVKLTKAIEKKNESDMMANITQVKDSLIRFRTLNMKYDFIETLGVSQLMESFKNEFQKFHIYLQTLNNKKSRLLIEDDDLHYLKEFHNHNYNLRLEFEKKVRLFYTMNFLPNE